MSPGFVSLVESIEDAAMTATANPGEKLEFRAELKQLLHLITHSLYSNREIFLRELISNSSDAINKIKFDSLEHEERLEGNKDWKIQILPDRTNNTLTVRDNGIGLSRQEAIDNLGTIAKSGTRAFLDSLKQRDTKELPGLIGQFGVGFYSAFMVADKVTVVSRQAGDPATGVQWESDGQGEFTVETVTKAERGTDVTLHLKEDSREFLQEYRLRGLVRKFSDFIEHPVTLEVERTEGEGEQAEKKKVEETLNSRKALWLRGKSEVTADEYAEFYKQISNDTEAPAKVIHYTAEGMQEFRVLLFIPAHRPLEFEYSEVKPGPRLYVQRVLIMDHCEALLPAWMRFVKGVVDSSDLPLNVSRELLQNDPRLERMQKDLVRSVLKALEEMKTEAYDNYVAFFKGLGLVLKEGLTRDWVNRKKIADLLLFESLKTEAGRYTTLADYVKAMPEGQKEIYYLIGEDREQLEQSPYVEACRAHGYDVLFLTDPIDEFALPALDEYDGKKLKAADRGDLSADAADETKKASAQERYQALLTHLEKKLSEVVSKVRLSARLKESAACLVADGEAMTAHMERLMQRLGRAGEDAPKRVLELNADHPAVEALRELYGRSPEDPRVEGYARILLDQAVIAEGSRVKDPLAFARRVNELLVQGAKT
jgi:molecular chaperone HtpG